MKKEAEGQSLFTVSNNEQKRRSAALVVRKLQTRMQRHFFKLSDQHGRPRDGGDADTAMTRLRVSSIPLGNTGSCLVPLTCPLPCSICSVWVISVALSRTLHTSSVPCKYHSPSSMSWCILSWGDAARATRRVCGVSCNS